MRRWFICHGLDAKSMRPVARRLRETLREIAGPSGGRRSKRFEDL